LAATLVAVALSAAFGAPAQADVVQDSKVTSVVVESDSAAGHIKLVLSFDNGISQAEAGKIRTALTDTARKPDIADCAQRRADVVRQSHQ
jgi:hypothetical protein